MSEAPPPPPSGEQPGYWPSGSTPSPQQPPAGGYGTPPAAPPVSPGAYGQQPGYGGTYGSPQGYPTPAPYASWGERVLGALIDYVAPFLVAGLVYAANKPIGAILYLAALAWALYQAYQNGSTGQSLGKRTIGMRVISERTGQTIGGGMGIARYFLHIVDGLPCYVGYLWPLWDSKRQTFSDKIVSTVVVKV